MFFARISLFLMIVFCVQQTVFAEPATREPARQTSADESSVSSDEEFVGRLPLYPPPRIRVEVESSEEYTGLFSEISGMIEREERAIEERPLEYLPPASAAYDAGYNLQSYRLFGPDVPVSPSLIMVNESQNNTYSPFMFLSISVKF